MLLDGAVQYKTFRLRGLINHVINSKRTFVKTPEELRCGIHATMDGKENYIQVIIAASVTKVETDFLQTACGNIFPTKGQVADGQ